MFAPFVLRVVFARGEGGTFMKPKITTVLLQDTASIESEFVSL
jgi:hypothetical protein